MSKSCRSNFIKNYWRTSLKQFWLRLCSHFLFKLLTQCCCCYRFPNPQLNCKSLIVLPWSRCQPHQKYIKTIARAAFNTVKQKLAAAAAAASCEPVPLLTFCLGQVECKRLLLIAWHFSDLYNTQYTHPPRPVTPIHQLTPLCLILLQEICCALGHMQFLCTVRRLWKPQQKVVKMSTVFRPSHRYTYTDTFIDTHVTGIMYERYKCISYSFAFSVMSV